MIYLDNAATTLRKPPQVIDAVVAAMGSFGNSARGTHEEALARDLRHALQARRALWLQAA
jgi:selenocysteine lyase/cysteine desulfurase